MKKSGWTWRGLSLAGLLGLAACGGGGGGYSNAPSNGNVGGVEPQAAIGVKIGKPYAIGDQMFTPRYDRYYDQVGVASWYGPGFHGKRTANGEVYDSNDMTCAHTTLPMPSLVKITNLDTNQTALVRVNDRGPFHGGRIVDLSRAAAEKLGVVAAGTARVRVQYLPEETEQYLASKGLNMPGAEVLNARNGLSIRPVESFTTQPREVAEATLPPPAAIGVKESYLRPPSPTPVQSEENQAQTVAMLQSPPPEPASEVVQLVQSPAPADAASPPSPPPPVAPGTLGTITLASKPAKFTPPKEESTFASNANWAVQVASFSDKNNAQRIMQKLSSVGQPNMREIDIAGKRWYRVLVWPGSETVSRDQLLASVQQLGLADAHVISNLK